MLALVALGVGCARLRAVLRPLVLALVVRARAHLEPGLLIHRLELGPSDSLRRCHPVLDRLRGGVLWAESNAATTHSNFSVRPGGWLQTHLEQSPVSYQPSNPPHRPVSPLPPTHPTHPHRHDNVRPPAVSKGSLDRHRARRDCKVAGPRRRSLRRVACWCARHHLVRLEQR